MALSQNTYVYMEAVEETQDQSAEPNQDGSTEGLGVAGWKQPQGILVHNTYSCRKYGNDKRKTDKQWLLRFSHSLSVSARQLLKAPYTRTVRCCERTAVSHRLLRDQTKYLAAGQYPKSRYINPHKYQPLQNQKKYSPWYLRIQNHIP